MEPTIVVEKPKPTPQIQPKNERQKPSIQQNQPQEQPLPTKRYPIIRGVKLTSEQDKTLREGNYIFLENMNKQDGSGKLSAFVFLDDEKKKVFFSNSNPDQFVKYGKYEMRLRDKILIEKGYLTKAKIKWYGIGTYAYPYLWKPDGKNIQESHSIKNPETYPVIENSVYCESFSDPRISKEQHDREMQEFSNRLDQVGKKQNGPKLR